MPLKFLAFLWMTLMACATCGAAAVTVKDAPAAGDFPLVSGARAAPLVMDADDHRVVTVAASCLADDVERVTGRKPVIAHARPDGPAVVLGSLDRSRVIQSLIDAGKLDVSDL